MEKHFRVLFKSEMMYEMSRRGGDRCRRDKGKAHAFKGERGGGAGSASGALPWDVGEGGAPRATGAHQSVPPDDHPGNTHCAPVFLGRSKPE